jgi:hypothetical protein
MTTPIFASDFRHAKTSGPERKWRGIMLHWSAGNGDGPALIKYLDGKVEAARVARATGKNPKKYHGWYHYVVDENNTWVLGDPKFNRGAHAGSPWNDHYIGVCMAHPIIASAAGRSAVSRRKLTTTERKWKGTQCFNLDPKVASATMELVYALCKQWDIPFELRTSTDHDVTKADIRGIICHHHVTNNKWDCEPWMETLEAARLQVLKNEKAGA